MSGYIALDHIANGTLTNGTLTRYIKTQDKLRQGEFYTKMPVYTNDRITTKLNREKTSISTPYHEIYFSFSDFFVSLCSGKYSSWTIAGLLTPTSIKSNTVTKQILFKRIDDGRKIAAIINIIGSDKSGLNDKFSNKIIFFQCPIRVVYVYDVNFDGGTINLVKPEPKFGNAITNINDPISSNVVYIADPNKVTNPDIIIEWFGGKSIKEIDTVINKIIDKIKPSLDEIQGNHDLQAKLEKLGAQPQSTNEPVRANVGGGKRRTKNNNYAITPKITRVYKNKRYHSKRNRRVKRNVITSSKRQSRKHSRTSRRK